MNYTVKQLRLYSLLHWLSYAFFSLIVPIILISAKYDLFARTGLYKATAMGIISVIIILFFLREQFKKFIEHMEDTKFKFAVKGAIRVFPLLLLLIAIQFAQVQFEKFFFIVTWSFVSNIISIVFEVYHEAFAYELDLIKEAKKQKRIDVIKAGIK